MSARGKLYQCLESLEAGLREALVPALRQTAAGGNDLLFLTRDTNPYGDSGPAIRNYRSERGEALLAAAREILALAAKLGEPTEGLLAARVLHYFHQANDLGDHHRHAPAGVARRFLQELGEGED